MSRPGLKDAANDLCRRGVLRGLLTRTSAQLPRPLTFEHGDLLSEGEDFEGGVGWRG